VPAAVDFGERKNQRERYEGREQTAQAAVRAVVSVEPFGWF
jgi:hypothetical protein